MTKLLKITAFALVSILSLPAYSQDNTQVFANCLADSLNGKERKELAKWIYLSMSVHPTLQSYSKSSDEDREQIDQRIGELVTRLLTENCPSELRAANKTDSLAIQRGFEFVGQVAMQEIMTNKATAEALAGYARYIDQEKIAAIATGEAASK
ncbi:MAG: hypothetical protein CME36_11120 [unclassified Hahellaceae]|nr:hypothetical protein [Hahellaceae bacterium]|tara:strand:+ start:21760 stop:22218 length:459 start_codon:yes stop_codon:yes gene_type:complete